jgi:hypothetical protein
MVLVMQLYNFFTHFVSFLCKQACKILCAKIIFGKLSFSQGSSSRNNRKFEIVFHEALK